MKGKYALVCTNERHDVVSVSLHVDFDSAREQMRKEYEAELAANVPVDSMNFGSSSSRLIISEHEDEYYWGIVKVDNL